MEIISVYMGLEHVDFIDLAWEDQVLVLPKGCMQKPEAGVKENGVRVH